LQSKDFPAREESLESPVSIHLPLWKRGIEGDLSNKISPNPSFPKRGTELLQSLDRPDEEDQPADHEPLLRTPVLA
jgi:hypothetical protein